MLKNTARWAVFAVSAILLTPALAGADNFKGRLGGTQFDTSYDTDGDGATVAYIEGAGRFSQLGNTSARGINEGLAWAGEFCSATELKLDTAYFHMILSAENGDMLFTEQTSVDLCWNFLDFSWTAVHYMQITGGTGRFASATGALVCYNAGNPLLTHLDAPVGYTWQAECSGSIDH